MVAAALCVQASGFGIKNEDMQEDFSITLAGAQIAPFEYRLAYYEGDWGQVFLLNETDRVVATSRTGEFSEVRLLPNEWVLDSATTEWLAVVVTSKRILGYNGTTNRWWSNKAETGEKFIEIQTGGRNAVVLTSERMLSFTGNGWKAHTRRKFR